MDGFSRGAEGLRNVALGRFSGGLSANLDSYRLLVGDALIDEVQSLARALGGVRICHINSTSAGGGVAELLARELPLLRALGLGAEWRLVHGPPQFFAATKKLHNALQGAPHELTREQEALYLEVNESSARLLERDYDLLFVHDPQPAALRHFAGRRDARWIWRCHVDSSAPEPRALAFLAPFLLDYDALVFTLPEFVPAELREKPGAFIAPAIDPLATKNMDLPHDLCKRAIADCGIDPARPLLVQVSRFDPWKDPVGTIEAYRQVKRRIPAVQLALIGAMAGDDPEGYELLARVEGEASAEPDVFILTNLGGAGSMEVNVFQRGADVVIQKSLREGFGLVVSEALWKEKPVVAGRAGGIPMQFPPGFERFLVDGVEECAERVVELLERPGVRGAFGRAGRERVRAEFLLPRLVRDELKLAADLVGAGPAG